MRRPIESGNPIADKRRGTQLPIVSVSQPNIRISTFEALVMEMSASVMEFSTSQRIKIGVAIGVTGD
jgi:hypothetical protein